MRPPPQAKPRGLNRRWLRLPQSNPLDRKAHRYKPLPGSAVPLGSDCRPSSAPQTVGAIVGSPSVAPDLYTYAMPKQKRPFVVEIEAKVTVNAFDEDSARKKVEKAFVSGRGLGVDVIAGAGVWTYVVVPQEVTSRT